MIQTVEYSLKSLDKPVAKIRKLMKQCHIFLLYGDVGAGKTTCMRALLESLSVPEPITSPTFTYVNEYYSSLLNAPLYHFDLYRISSIDEFYQLGLDHCLQDETAFFFFEWPERIMPLFLDKKDICHLYFQYIPDLEKRRLTIKVA
jgi:tRNA threonylcarbamoyladenosine biosynthesis protein TsaE